MTITIKNDDLRQGKRSGADNWTYRQRIEALRATKLRQTQDKQELIGSMDHDDWALILPPEDRRKIVQTMSTSGMPITDCLIDGFEPQSNHPSGGFFGPKAVGANYRALLEAHPPYVDPNSSLAGGYSGQLFVLSQAGLEPRPGRGSTGPRTGRADPALPAPPRHRRHAALLPGPADRPRPGLGRHPGQDPTLSRDQPRIGARAQRAFRARRRALCPDHPPGDERLLRRPGGYCPGHAELDRAHGAEAARAGRVESPIQMQPRTCARWPR